MNADKNMKIGKNVFLNDIYFDENKNLRFIYKNGNKIYENKQNPSFEMGYVLNREQEEILFENIFEKEFLISYDRSLNKIFKTFYDLELISNQNKENSFKDSKDSNNKEKWDNFVSIYKKRMLSIFIKAWILNLDYSHIEWAKWMSIENGYWNIGIQYGIAQFLKDRKEQVFEFVNHDMQASSLKHHNKIIFCKNSTKKTYAPYSEEMDLDLILRILNNQLGFKKDTKDFLKEDQILDKSIYKIVDKNIIKIFWLKENDIKEISNKSFKDNNDNTDKKKIGFFKKINTQDPNSILKENHDNEKILKIVSELIKEKHKVILISDKNIKSQEIVAKKTIVNLFNGEKEKPNLVNIYYFNFNKISSEEVVKFEDFSKGKFNYLNKDELIKLNQEEIKQTLIEDGREEYKPVSKISDGTGMISSKISNEVYHALKEIKKERKNLDEWIAKLLKIEKDELKNRLSAEQIDAIALGISSLLKNKGLIIADETGFGKGRILAAISLIGLNMGKKVVFFTENKQLFSDFYRDILAVNKKDAIPMILNQTGKIYDPDGNLVVDKLSTKNFKKMIEEQKWTTNLPFLITNYAQINKKGFNPKVEFLKALKPDWIILDEAHNASGNSNVNENLKKLIDISEGVIFSSATYAKTEEKLALYDKALPLNDISKNLIKIALGANNDELRETITKEMAKQGNFIRREHPPIELPEILFIEEDGFKERFDAYCEMWRKIFKLAEIKEDMMGNISAKAWLTLGAVFARANREFAFLEKSKGIIKEIETIIKRNEKVVLVTEITFEAILRDLVEGDINLDIDERNNDEVNSNSKKSKKDDEIIFDESEDDNEEGKEKLKKSKKAIFEEKPNWNWKWLTLLEKMTDSQELEKELKIRQKDPEFNYSHYQKTYPEFMEYAKEVEEEIVKNNYFGLSPLDEIKQNLLLKNIKMTELSGRTYQCYKSKDSEGKTIWIIDNKLEKKERHEIVADFNKGLNDVVLITRSGASGISLHAGEKFKDQRKRNLIELDIATNSANRIQFLGRVRRKDQVCEPNFYTLLLNILPDIRKIEVEKRKQVKLSAHVGGRKENKILDWISEEGDLIVEEWAKENRNWAKKIGAFKTDDGFKRIDRALSRSLILPDFIQKVLLKRIEYGILAHTDYHFYQSIPLPLSQSVYKKFLWGNPLSKTETKFDNSILNLGNITINYRLWFLPQKDKKDHLINKMYEKDIFTGSFDKNKNHILNEWFNIQEQYGNLSDKNNSYYLAKTFLNKLEQGDLFIFDFKNHKKTGVVLDISSPFMKENKAQNQGEEYDLLKEKIIHFDKENKDKKSIIEKLAAYSLNTITLKVLFEDDENTVNIPLKLLLNIKLLNKKIDLKDFYRKDLTFYTLTIEGNPLLCSLWSKKMNVGKMETIYDLNEGSKNILLLKNIENGWGKNTLQENPNFGRKIEDFDKITCPFANEDQIKDWLYQHIKNEWGNSEEEKVLFNHPFEQDAEIGIRMIKENGKTFLEVGFLDRNVYKKYLSRFLLKSHFFIQERKEINGITYVRYYANKLYQVLSLMKDDGVFFYCDKNWFLKNISKYIPNT